MGLLWVASGRTYYSSFPLNSNRVNRNHLEGCLSSSTKNRISLCLGSGRVSVSFLCCTLRVENLAKSACLPRLTRPSQTDLEV